MGLFPHRRAEQWNRPASKSAGQDVARPANVCPRERRPTMAKAMTKSEIATQLAEKAGISKKQVNQILEAQADLAYRQAKNQFPIPGIGKLVLVERPARTMIMQFGPKKGQTINVPKKKVL